ncbi:MAG TPA: DNA polymerase Y family protein [Rhizomicrobium sp.]|nr:DNA polymerase Y family protein [Rhizomicrobium sp.]
MTNGFFATRRILALWLPRLPTDRLRRRNAFASPDEPLVLSMRSGNARVVYAVDRNAARLKLRPGMPLASARAIVNTMTVAEADLPADETLLAGIADWCDRFTPLVALDPPHGLILDITGASSLFSGEAEMLKTVRDAIADQGFAVCAAIAGTKAAARALARYAPGVIAASGEEAVCMAPLPVSALDLDIKDTHALRRAGLKTIGQVAGRTRDELMARFGKLMMQRLDHALGLGDEPISPQRVVPDFMAEHRFAEPVVTESFIADTLAALARSLSQLLEERGQGVRLLEAAFFRSDGIVRRIAIEMARPLRDPEIIARLFRTRLDALNDPLDPGFGFDLIRLSALHAERLVAESVSLDTKADEDKEIAFLIDRLSARFGAYRVLTFQPQDTHIPEAAGVAVPAQHADDTTLAWDTRNAGEPPRRPIRLFERPECIDVVAEVPDGPPASFKWRRVRHLVSHAEGPERIAMEWWHAHGRTRDYFRVEDRDGRRFWVYRDGIYGRETADPRWYMHGLFA